MTALELRTCKIMKVELDICGDGSHVEFEGKKWVKDYMKFIGLTTKKMLFY